MTREECIKVLQALWRYKDCEYSEHEIRESLDMAIKALDNLDKIKAEIIEKSITDCELHGCGTSDLLIDTSEALAIIDKYTAGSEVQDEDSN